MTTSQSKFAQALASDRLVVTAECYPPHSGDAEAVKKLATVLPPELDAVVVADNPDDIYGSALACAGILAHEGHETVLTLSTRDRNRIALESDALGAGALGVSGVLCLSGNHQSLGACPQAGSAYDIDSTQLLRLVKGLELPLVLGAVAHPHQKPVELGLVKLKKKIAAGAGFVLTQPVFDLVAFQTWMGTVQALKPEQQIPVIASVLLFTSLEQAESLQKTQIYGPLPEAAVARLTGAADVAKEGLALAVEMASQLKSVPGVRGLHLLCGGNEALAGEVVKAAGLT
jgi:5,10-methylenetetrahydrofolate reductase